MKSKANKGRIYDSRYSDVIVLSSVASFITTFVLPSFELAQNANNKTIKEMRLAIKITDILKANKIKKIKELCKLSITDLKEMDIKQKESEKIQIELQLLGLDLRNG